MNRSPAAAGVLSVVFPGLGHLYGGATHRAVALGAVFVALLQAAVHGQPWLLMAMAAVWLFSIVDATRVAEESARARAEGRRAVFGLDRNWAVALVAAGIICTLAVIPGVAFVARLWPLALVVIGIQMLRGRPVVPRFGEGAAPGTPGAPPPGPAAGTPPVTAVVVEAPPGNGSGKESAGATGAGAR